MNDHPNSPVSPLSGSPYEPTVLPIVTFRDGLYAHRPPAEIDLIVSCIQVCLSEVPEDPCGGRGPPWVPPPTVDLGTVDGNESGASFDTQRLNALSNFLIQHPSATEFAVVGRRCASHYSVVVAGCMAVHAAQNRCFRVQICDPDCAWLFTLKHSLNYAYRAAARPFCPGDPGGYSGYELLGVAERWAGVAATAPPVGSPIPPGERVLTKREIPYQYRSQTPDGPLEPHLEVSSKLERCLLSRHILWAAFRDTLTNFSPDNPQAPLIVSPSSEADGTSLAHWYVCLKNYQFAHAGVMGPVALRIDGATAQASLVTIYLAAVHVRMDQLSLAEEAGPHGPMPAICFHVATTAGASMFRDMTHLMDPENVDISIATCQDVVLMWRYRRAHVRSGRRRPRPSPSPSPGSASKAHKSGRGRETEVSDNAYDGWKPKGDRLREPSLSDDAYGWKPTKPVAPEPRPAAHEEGSSELDDGGGIFDREPEVPSPPPPIATTNRQ